jgi:alpha-1,2-mannosyltransferase
MTPPHAIAGLRLPAIGSRWFNAIAFVLALASVALYVQQFHRQEVAQFGDMIDLQTYRWGGMSTWHSPTELYTVQFMGSLPFLYPPIAAVVFSVASHASFNGDAYAITAASLASLAWCIWAAWGWLGRRALAERAGLTAAVFAITLWLEPVQQTLGFGQINLILMALAVGDLALPDHGRIKGIGVGLATGFKLTPAVFIVYLLITRRFRAAAVGVASFLGTVAIGFAVLPAESRQYWGGAFVSGRNQMPYFMANQSVNGMVQRLVSSGGAAHLLWETAAAVVTIAGLYLAYRMHRTGRDCLEVMVCAFVALLVSPISWTHHYVWVVPFLVLLVERCWLSGRAGLRWVPFAFTAAFLAWPMRIATGPGVWNPYAPLLATGLIWFIPHRDSAELHWNDYQVLVGNYYVFAALAVAIALPAWLLWRERRSGTTASVLAASVPAPSASDDEQAAVPVAAEAA